MDPMTPATVLSPGQRLWRTLVGAALALTGAVVLTVVVMMIFSEDPVLVSLGFKLGLALSSMVSALGQIVLLIGLWLLWSARPVAKRP